MKFRSILLAVCTALCIVACDEETSTIGNTLTNDMDHLLISTDTFNISTNSIAAGSVLARTPISYLGTVCDPETGDFIKANYMTQFHILEDYEFPKSDLIISRDADNMIVADSCELRLFFDSFYGDSLTSMKVTAYELDKDNQMKENIDYLSDFDPKKEGIVRADGLNSSKVYSLTDFTVPEKKRDDEDYTKNIRVSLNKEYTDKDGNKYNNYGTYIMRKYYENPGNFKNAIKLAKNVAPGFYFESTGGVGNMAYITLTQLNLYFKYKGESADTAYTGTTSLAGTQEVLQRTQFCRDGEAINAFVNDHTCTYLKTPAGVFTEVEFPIDEIVKGHDNDTINSAKFSLQQLNSKVDSKYSLDAPTELMILPADSLSSFFAQGDVTNYRTSFLGTYSSKDRTYTFNNIGSLIKAMQMAKQHGETSPNWNKAVIVPVTTSKNNSNVITKITHNMTMTSTRLVGGSENPYDPIKISVIYSRYK